MARLAFAPFLRVFKDNGDVCTDATATWYLAGTTTLTDTYTTSALSTPNTNPVAASSLGIFPAMWLADGVQYKVKIEGTGITTQTIDYVYSTASLDQLSGDRRYLGLAGGAAYITSGSANAYVVTTGLSTGSLATHEALLLFPNFTNTGAATLNVDGIGAKSIFANGAALAGGEIISGVPILVAYNGTQFDLINSASAVSPRNRVVNPQFLINQEAAASSADDTYGHDCWYVLTQSGAVAVSTLSDIENGGPSGARITQSQASAQRFGYATILETKEVKDLRAKAVSLISRVRLSTTATLRYAILEWTGTADSVTSDVVNDWTSSTYTAGNFFNSTTLTVLKVGTVSCTAGTAANLQDLNNTQGSSMNNVILFIWTEATAAQNVTLDIWNVDYYAGSVARAFAAPDHDVDRRKCQRYKRYVGCAGGGTATTTILDVPINWDDMRIVPSISQNDTAPDVRIFGSTTSNIAGTISTVASQFVAGSGSAHIAFTRTSGTWTAGLPAFIAQSGWWLKLDAQL